MSDEERDDFEASLEDLRHEVMALTAGVARVSASATTFERVAPWVKLLVVGAFVFGGWVTTIEVRQHLIDGRVTVLSENDAKKAQKDAEFELWRAHTTATQYTAQQAQETVAKIQESLMLLDKRQTRTEDALEGIKDMLDRIERRLPLAGPSAAR
jgi:uncharacterized protein (DUF1786 family)